MPTCPLNSSLILSWLRSIWMAGESFDVGGDSDRTASYQEWPGRSLTRAGWLSPARLTQARTRPGGRTLRARWRQGVIAVSADCVVPLPMLESSLLQAQYGQRLLRPADGLSQGDFGPAQTHRNPGGDQLQHELAGVTTIIRQVIGKLDAGAPLFRHEPHFKRRRACRKPVPVHRQPVPFGYVEEHCRIAARGNDPPGRGIRLEPMLFEILLPHHALHSILSIQDVG